MSMHGSWFWRLISVIRRAAPALLAFFLALPTASAVSVRVAAWNVLWGVGTPGSNDYNAVKSILLRIRPEIIGFEELNDADYANWVALAAELDYPYLAYGTGGPYAGSHRVGVLSKYPIIEAVEVKEPEGAKSLRAGRCVWLFRCRAL